MEINFGNVTVVLQIYKGPSKSDDRLFSNNFLSIEILR